MGSETFSLIEKATEIEKNDLLLPNFQRNYEWNESALQKEFLASILARIPLGNIITFEDDPSNFGCRIIGTTTSIKNVEKDKVKFLLDGQQRLTTLLLIFSNRLFKHNGEFTDVKDLISSGSIRKRFFVNVLDSNTGDLERDDDLFGYLNFNFFKNVDNITYIPNFCSNDLIDNEILSVISFTENDNRKWFHPRLEPTDENATDLERDASELVKMDGENLKIYRIPLFWLLDNPEMVKNVIEEIASQRVDYLCREYAPSNSRKSLSDLNNVFHFFKTPKELSACTDDMLRRLLTRRSEKWGSSFFKYLQDCINELKVVQIEVNKEGRERAIDIYEALNKNGVALSKFDLIVARAAKNEKSKGLNEVLKENIQGYCNKRLLKKLTTDITDWNGELFGIYDKTKFDKTIIDQFLNLLCIVSNVSVGNMSGSLTVKYTKEKAILSLTPDQIYDYAELCIKSIIDAIMYLNIKQGIYKLSNIQYKLTILPIAYAFYIVESNSNRFFNADNGDLNFVLNLLNAWYKIAIFTDFYQMKQNTRVIDDVIMIDNAIMKKQLPSYFDNDFEKRLAYILNVRHYNDESTLLYRDLDYVPSKSVEMYLELYFLSMSPAYDIIRSNDSVKLISPYRNFKEQFEIHHFIPLYAEKRMSEQKTVERTRDVRDCKLLINSPLNKVIITKDSNRRIADLLPQKYESLIPQEFLSQTGFSTEKFDFSNSSEEGLISDKFLDEQLSKRYKFVAGKIKDDIRNSVKEMKNYIKM